MKVNAVAVLAATLIGIILISAQTEIFYQFSELFYRVITLCFFLFLAGYVFTRFLVPAEWWRAFGRVFVWEGRSPAKWHKAYIFCFYFFSLLGYLDRFLMFGPGFFLPETVMQYRILLTQENGASIIKGLSLGNFFIFLMPTYLILRGKRFTRFGFYLALATFLMDIYLSSARSSLFLSALVAFFFWAFSKKLSVSFLGKVSALLGLLALGFTLIGEVVGKSSEELGILVYAAAPLHAFDEIINSSDTLEGYFLTFFPIQGVLGKLFGFAASTELPNVFTPLPTNVYSMYGVFFSDYGFIGLFTALFLAGGFSGFVEGAFNATHSVVFRVFSALNLAILTLSVFYDYYTTSGVVWMTFILTPIFFIDDNDQRFSTVNKSLPRIVNDF